MKAEMSEWGWRNGMKAEMSEGGWVYNREIYILVHTNKDKIRSNTNNSGSNPRNPHIVDKNGYTIKRIQLYVH